MSPSPRSHVYRLLLLLALALAGFVGILQVAVPVSWDSEHWYRADAAVELRELPMRYGGNASCQTSSCHDDQRPQDHQADSDKLARGPHRGLSCESCHGNLALHVAGGAKTQAAQVAKENSQCLNCHRALAGRPEGFPRFKEDLQEHQLLQVNAVTDACSSCHDPHEPDWHTPAR